MNLDRRTIALSAALFFGTLLVFSGAVSNDFVNYDDPEYVTDNPRVQAGLTPGGIRWAATTGAAANWHPLTWISHMMDWSLFEDDPRGHHAVSIGLHALNAVLVFLLFQRLTNGFWLSVFSAALFAWHPLRVESVAWIAERKDVLSGFFGLFALWAYVVYAQERRARVVLDLVRHVHTRTFGETDAGYPAADHVAPRCLATATLPHRAASRETAIFFPGGGLVCNHARRPVRRWLNFDRLAAVWPYCQCLRRRSRLPRKIFLAG
jgi:hypothetical protein